MIIKDEQSFYLSDPKKTSSVKSRNSSVSTLNDETMNEDAEKEGSSQNEEDTRVEFFSNKAINESDLEYLLLCVESRRKSGGGDFDSYELDNSRRHLTVKYREKETKRRVLEKEVIRQNRKHKKKQTI